MKPQLDIPAAPHAIGGPPHRLVGPFAGLHACCNCGRRLDIRDPERLVCIAHLEFRSPHGGGNCEHYIAAKPFPEPPQLADGGRSG